MKKAGVFTFLLMKQKIFRHNSNAVIHSHTLLTFNWCIKFYYGEFDGRRDKRILIKIIGE